MDLLDRLLGHDLDTTCLLLAKAAELSDNDLDHKFDLGHRTVRQTFDHIVWNVECWTDLMRHQPIRARSKTPPSIATLKTRLDAASSELLAFARQTVDDGQLNETFLDDGIEKSFGGAIVHVATHGMHHRAQLLYMLRRLGVPDLPEGDALSWEASQPQAPPAPPRPIDEIDANPTAEEVTFFDDQLEEYGQQHTGRDDFRSLNAVIRYKNGNVIAGLKSVTGWDWLHVRVLWIAETHRRAGLGTRLLDYAEQEAVSRGCVGSCLSSFSFQAPDFYLRRGYRMFGCIDDYPVSETLFFFSKRFDDGVRPHTSAGQTA